MKPYFTTAKEIYLMDDEILCDTIIDQPGHGGLSYVGCMSRGDGVIQINDVKYKPDDIILAWYSPRNLPV